MLTPVRCTPPRSPSDSTWSGTYRTCVVNTAPLCAANDCKNWQSGWATCTNKADNTPCTSNGAGEAPRAHMRMQRRHGCSAVLCLP